MEFGVKLLQLLIGGFLPLLILLAPTLSISEETPNKIPSLIEAPQPSYNINILSAEDVERYKKIVILQKDGKWAEADKIIGTIENDILMGHIEYQRFMHPKKYRSKFAELSGWLAEYRDHPGANRLYRLAQKRRGNARQPNRPMAAVKKSNPLAKSKEVITPQPKPIIPAKQYSKDDRKEIARVKARIGRYVQRGQPDRAEKRLWAFERRGTLKEKDFDEELSRIASSYFFEGEDEKAFALASFAANRSREHFSQGDWVSGLTAWRLKKCDTSSIHFQAVLNSTEANSWMKSGAAFWAARSEIRCQRPENVESFLKRALEFPDTFYGQIAAKQLGVKPNFNWDLPKLNEDDYNDLINLPGVRRAIALDQIGDDVTADTEIRLVWSRRQTQNRSAIISLAANLNLPASQAIIARATSNAESFPHSVLYPIPDWEPDGGFTMDKALLFAIMRQESYFRPTAQSWAGAMGLLQLMPDTASYISKDKTLRSSNKSTLLEPNVNMTIGQKYMLYLLNSNLTEGNLFKFATAYNGGPGNMSKWQDNIDFLNDPLYYIESLPAWETRNFIERVFSNFWIYRSRLGQPSPSLDAIASGAWPPYEELDFRGAFIPQQKTKNLSTSSQK